MFAAFFFMVVLTCSLIVRAEAADNRSTQTITASNITLYVNSKTTLKVSSRTSRTYVSRNTGVATVSSAGVVTGKKVGTTYITIKAKGTTKYKEASKTIKVTVKATPNYVTLYNYTGSKVLKTVKVGASKAVVLPSIPNPYGYTFVGWAKSPQPFVTDSKPINTWSSGATITGINGNLKLYAVLSKRAEETDIPVSSLPKLKTSKYSHLIFVGDSRTEHMRLLFSRLDYDTSNLSFITRPGGGLDWLRASGYYRLLDSIQEHSGADKPIAVVFNFGVNDMPKLSTYVGYMKQIAPTLQRMNCQLFYMSVNPYNCAQIQYINSMETYSNRHDSDGVTFNRILKAQLAGDYQFIDTCTYLCRTGYGMDLFTGGTNVNRDDGLHYTEKTYKRIFKYCLSYVNGH